MIIFLWLQKCHWELIHLILTFCNCPQPYSKAWTNAELSSDSESESEWWCFLDCRKFQGYLICLFQWETKVCCCLWGLVMKMSHYRFTFWSIILISWLRDCWRLFAFLLWNWKTQLYYGRAAISDLVLFLFLLILWSQEPLTANCIWNLEMWR